MNVSPKVHYLLELAKLVGRLGYSLEANDTLAFIGILTQIEKLTTTTVQNVRPRMQMRIPDDPRFDYDTDDDAL